jgi:hypothetical protein
MTIPFQPATWHCIPWHDAVLAQQTSVSQGTILVTIPEGPRKCNFPAHRSALAYNQSGSQTVTPSSLHPVTLSTGFRVVLLALIIICGLLAAPKTAFAQTPPPDAPGHYFLTPGANTQVKLHTHLADFRLGYEGAALLASLDAHYRLQNSTTDAQTVLLALTAFPPQEPLTLPDNLVLLVDETPLILTPTENGGLAAEVQVPADSTLDVQLNYVLDLGHGPLSTLRYAITELDQWPGQPSLRVSIAVPTTIPTASWLGTMPAGWTFAPTSGDTPLIRWLYDVQLPETTFVFRFIHPATWDALAQAAAVATPGAPPANFAALGDLYQQLYDQSEDELGERFYAQALAAYTAGVTEATALGLTPQEQAPLHAGLATLYQRRSVAPDGSPDPTYTTLLAQAAQLALAGLPSDDPRRRELLQWQVAGLTLELNQARDQRNWATAFALLDQLASLPSDIVDAATLAETRRAITVQQALGLLAEGDSNAAMQMVGTQITNESLLPPLNARPLFVTWQVTATISAERTGVLLTGFPAAERSQEALAALRALVQQWGMADRDDRYGLTLNERPTTAGGWQLQVTLPANAGGNPLAQAIPAGAEWALLRTLLAQLAPRVEGRVRGLHRELTLVQPLDLRGAGEEWAAVATTLEEQAAQFDAQGPPIDLADADTVTAESALLLRIKAANYRQAALAWRTLARNSLVAVQLAADSGVQRITRTWLATPETPLQTLELQASVLSMGSLLLVVTVAFAGLFGVAGALWRLL